MSKSAFLFPGQGAQTVGMGQALAQDLPQAKAIFDHANEVLGYDLAEICFNGPPEKLNSTAHSQPGLFVCSLAALERLKLKDPALFDSVSAAAGLSLGEYTALVFADAMEFSDALRVVQCRGQAMQDAADATPSGMVSVLGLNVDEVQELCNESRRAGECLEIANYLCPGNLVCSGHQSSCHELASRAASAGAMKAIPLKVAGAFHTQIMQPAVEPLKTILLDTPIRAPRLPVISNVDAKPHTDPDEIREVLVRQVVSPVRWEPSMRSLIGDGFDTFCEVGPGKVLRGLLRRIDRKLKCENYE